MKGFFKKSTSLVLALMMVLSMFAGMTFTATAATDATTGLVTFENIEDNLSADYSAIGGVTTTNPVVSEGKLNLTGDQEATSHNIKIGGSNFNNYVFEADFYLAQDENLRKPGRKVSGTDGFNIQIGGIDTRLLGGTVVSKTEVDPTNSKAYLLEGNEVDGVTLQNMDQAGSNYDNYRPSYTGDIGKGWSGKFNLDSGAFHVRYVVLNGMITITATHGTVSYTYSIIQGEKKTDITGHNSQIVIGMLRYDNGVIGKIDNIKVAKLNDAAVELAGLNVPAAQIGTADSALSTLEANVLTAKAKVTALGSTTIALAPATIVADNYDTTKPGVRNATYKSGLAGTTVAQCGVAYTSDTSTYSSVDFEGAVEGWTIQKTNYASIVDADNDGDKELLVAATSGTGAVFTTDAKYGDFHLEYDIAYTRTSDAVSTIFLNSLRSASATATTGSKSWEFAYYNDKGAQKIRLYERQTTATSIAKVMSKNDLHVKMDVVGNNIKIELYDRVTGALIYGHNVFDATKDNMNATGHINFGFQSNGGSMPEIMIDNILVRPIADGADQSACGAPIVSANTAATYDINTNTLTVTGTVSQNFYGFKPSVVTNLADCPAYYNGDNTATVVANGEYITIPCTMAETSAKEVEVKLDKATELSTTALEFTTNYREMAVEYDITPYLLDYFKNPAISIRFHGDGTQYGGKTVTFYEVGLFYPAYGSSTKTDGVVFEVGSEGVPAEGNYARLYYRGADSKLANVANGFHGIVTNTVVTEENFAAQVNGGTGSTSNAPATKKTEGVVTYRVRIVVQNGNLSYQVAEKGEGAIDWSTIEPVTFGNCGINGTFDFLCGNAYAAATLNNVTVQDLTADALTDNYVADAEAVVVGTPAEALTFTNVTKLNQKIAMIGYAADKIEGYDANKTGAQNVTITKNGVSFTKRVIVSAEEITVFEDFSSYNPGDKIATNFDNGAAIAWNSNQHNEFTLQEDGTMLGAAWNALINSTAYRSNDGTMSVDVSVPSIEGNLNEYKAFALVKFNSFSFDFAILTTPDTKTNGKAYAMINYIPSQNEDVENTRVLAVKEIDFAFDTTYRMEIRVYGNTVKGVLDGKTVINYVMATDDAAYADLTTVAAQQGNEDRFGFFHHANQTMGKFLGLTNEKGEYKNIGNTVIKVDNILKTNTVANTYTVDGSAIGNTNTLPTIAQPGDKVVVTADVNANGVLKVNGKNVFQNAAADFGGTGTEFVFTMPAADAVITAEGDGMVVDTVASGIRTDKTAVRFLNRIYLLAGEGGLSVEGVKSFGAVILPKDLLGEAELTLKTDRAKNAVAFDGKDATLYDVTGKYADFSIAVTTSDADREFACRAYVEYEDGTILYGDTMVQSINGWIAQ